VDPHALLARARALTSSFTRTQLLTLAAAFVLVVAIVAGSAWYVSAPTYALLFTDMDPESAAQVVTRLKGMNVAYELADGGRTVRVDSARLDEVRLELASQGLPGTGRVGFEIFDRTAFGATEFLEQVNYRRALEGEIARTIAALSEVSSARVHIAMGRDSLFGESRPAKASVVLMLRHPERPLAPSTVTGIVNLVAASVEGLRPDSVVVIDGLGRPLSRPDQDETPAAEQLERQQRLEREMAARVVALLEPVVGIGRVRANVALTLDSQSLEQTEEVWDPSTVVRSRQTTSDQSIGASPTLVAGARGNLPPPANADLPAPAVSTPGSTRTSEITNYEVGRTTRHTVRPGGDITRISVAVVVDDDVVQEADESGAMRLVRRPRTAEELEKLQALVAASIGLDPARGDRATVENIAFGDVVVDAPPPTWVERYGPVLREVLRVVAVLVLALAAFFIVVRPLMRRAAAMPTARGAAVSELPAAAGDRPRTVAEIEKDIEAQLEAEVAAAQRADSRRLPVLTRRVSSISLKDPENVAKLLRSWMTEDRA
jgi:flagellar M-ring protein FliF